MCKKSLDLSWQSAALLSVVCVSERCSDAPAAGLLSARAWAGRGRGLHRGCVPWTCDKRRDQTSAAVPVAE